PNQGSFKVETPTGEKVERIEVFDHRGRFITAKDFETTDLEYAMQLGYLQEAVYVLKIKTNETTVTRRIIYKN
ncbi:MAG: T9SS type A sorting domain-containing protein, partial [Christiangramia sp.]|nr:T9SS type A sorting domain-containing protein [Christiangramia sp.]